MSSSPSAGGPSASASTSPPPPPKNRHNLTPTERQALAVSRLLSDPTRDVRLPAPPREKALRAPREMMKNVSGSSAGAGSGEFHVYKHARRREYERIRLLEEGAEKEKATSEFLISQAQQAAKDEAKTSKNRAKRDKKKLARERAKAEKTQAQGGGAVEPGSKRKRDDSGNGGEEAVPQAKVRAAPGAEAVKFQSRSRAGRSDADGEEQSGSGSEGEE